MFQGDSDQLPPELPTDARLGMAIASLILGILAIAMSFMVVGLPLAVVGLVLGAIHLRAGRGGRGMAAWGVGLSSAGLLAGIGFISVYIWFYSVHIQPMLGQFPGAEDGPALDRWEGVRSPDFSVTTMDGATLTLSELRGKRIVVAMWATWCPPCVEEVPHLIKLTDEVPSEELVIVGISDEPEDVIRKFAEEKGINYALVSTEQLPAPYGDVTSIPVIFMIDRNGVIQRVLEGYHEFDDLRAAATAPDFDGTPLDEPLLPANELKEPAQAYDLRPDWTAEVAGATALFSADWNGDGGQEFLVCTREPSVVVLGRDGSAIQTVPMPEAYEIVAVGRAQGATRLLGYSNWGERVDVLDSAGAALWDYKTTMGVNGAHWIDVEGDGIDEMVVGLNGSGGLHLVSAEGKRRWKVTLGNCWNQAAVRTAGGRTFIFATEAGGSVRIYDAEGESLGMARPRGDYYAHVAAAVIDGGETVQVIAGGAERTVAMDESGEEVWSTPAEEDHGAWRSTAFASGDANQDGQLDWAFFGLEGTLLVASPAGERLAELPGQRNIGGFALADGRLVTLMGETVSAYGFAPAPGAAPAPDAEAARHEEATPEPADAAQGAPVEQAPEAGEAPDAP